MTNKIKISNFMSALTDVVENIFHIVFRLLMIATALGCIYLTYTFFLPETQHAFNRLSAGEQIVELFFTALIPLVLGIGLLIWGMVSSKEEFLHSINM